MDTDTPRARVAQKLASKPAAAHRHKQHGDFSDHSSDFDSDTTTDEEESSPRSPAPEREGAAEPRGWLARSRSQKAAGGRAMAAGSLSKTPSFICV